MRRDIPCYGGRHDRDTGALYCPWGVNGEDWTPDDCEMCESELVRQQELWGDCQRDEGEEVGCARG